MLRAVACALRLQTMPDCVHQPFGLRPGGLNFDAKLRRESTDLKDIFYAHIRCAVCLHTCLQRMCCAL